MTNDFISASEVAEYIYCNRAWWYRQHGTFSTQEPVMQAGIQAHEVLTGSVTRLTRLRRLAWRVAAVGAALLIVVLVLRALTGTG